MNSQHDERNVNVNASDQFFAGGQALNYGKDMRWQGRPRGGMVVTEPHEEQQTDINTRQPLFWDAARTQPKTQLVFTVVCDGSGPAAQHGWHTDERVDAQDRGHRDVYIKGKDKIDAVKAQLREHGRPGIRVGDYYYECLTGERPGKTPGTTARTWAVMLFPGAGEQQTSFFGNEPQPPAAPAPSAPQGFGQPAPGYQAVGNPVGAAPHPSVQNWGSPQGTPVAQPQSNAYGFGHQPPESPGGQAYQQAQGAAQGFNAPPPQFQPPAAPQPSAPQGFGAFGQTAPPAQPQGFGQPVPPVDDPWGQAAPAQQAVQNPYG